MTCLWNRGGMCVSTRCVWKGWGNEKGRLPAQPLTSCVMFEKSHKCPNLINLYTFFKYFIQLWRETISKGRAEEKSYPQTPVCEDGAKVMVKLSLGAPGGSVS